MPLPRQLLALLTLVSCLLSGAGFAADALAPASLQQQLAALDSRQLPEAERKQARDALETALRHARDAETTAARLAALDKQLKAAPTRISAVQQQLAGLKNAAPADISGRHAKTDLATLEKLFTQRGEQLARWQGELAEANTRLVNAQTRPERAQADISAGQNRLTAIANQLGSGKAMGGEQRIALMAEERALKARIQLLRAELAGNNLLQELSQTERELLTAQIARIESEIQALQTLINDQRRAHSEQIIAQLWREAGAENANSLLARQNAINLDLSNALLAATDQLNSLTQRNLAVRQQLESLRQSDQALEELIEVLQGSLLLARILQEQRNTLPEVEFDGSLTDRIADIRLDQFELGQQREALANPQAYVDRLLAGETREVPTDELRVALTEVATARAELIERVNKELGALLNEAITLQLNQKELQTTASALRAKLDEQLFWIPSNKPLDGAWLLGLPAALFHQTLDMPWRALATELWEGLRARPLVFLPLLILIPVLLWRRRWLASQLDLLQRNIGFVRQDKQWYTPLAMAITVIQCLPFSLFLVLCGYALTQDARGGNLYLGAALFNMALVWLVFHSLYRLLAHGGVAEVHFRWARGRTRYLRRLMLYLGSVLLPMSAVVTIGKYHPGSLGGDVLGISTMLVTSALLTWLLPRLFWYRATEDRLSAFRWLVGVAAGVFPLGLILGVVMGYYYTSLTLAGLMITSLYLLILWRLVEAMVVRSLALAAQRIAYQRIVKRQAGETRDGVEGLEVMEEPVLNIEQINQQSLRLARLALTGLFLVLLYWVWADLFTLFAYLDRITLYEYSSGSGDTQTLVPISLRDVIGALAIVAISLMLARNIPGLLEVTVLSRMKLAQGSAYTTTTLLSYIIFSIGFVATLGALGVSWDKLQWLVAALSVGLGFGLQEIFANFISGLIILFERPARIGDVVTIGNLSGTVSRIRIRATTITDFDRKEIIVPNKVFVTDQLINWSLTDTVTRVIVRVGVAYGSDLNKVRDLLYRIADENSRVLKDPPPMVYFLNFGASTLDHELRVHVRELGDRNPTIDEINRRIDELFREHDIQIAFNQVDVHIRGVDSAQWHALTPASPNGSDGGAGREQGDRGETPRDG